MPKNDDGEFEHVLGNKQVLSIFFIVIILLGLFFTMGYIVGRNSGPADTAKKNGPGDAAPPARTDAQSSMPGSTPVASTPAPPVAEPISVEPVTPRSIETPAPKPPVHREPAGVALAHGSATASMVQPAPGEIYVQVVAVAKPQAEVLAEVLIKKGFKAVVAAGPDETKYRVLVGPAKDASDAGRIKGDLEQAGFKQAFPKKF